MAVSNQNLQPVGISIVTISFNQGPYLEEAIQSVLAQRRPGLDQYIVVDPGSTDGSRDIIARYRDQIDELILDPDRGPADGLNRGFARAKGDVFAYVNADDRLVPGALETAREFFVCHPAVDVLCGAIRIIDGQGRASPRKRTADPFDIRRYVAGVCTVGQQGTFLRRASFERSGGFNPANRVSWDGELLVDMALGGARFATIFKVLGEWRIYADTITGSANHRVRLDSETARIAANLRDRGFPLYAEAPARIVRALYKIHPVRHVGYWLVR
jgi:glycosyltransferase involved in cell wall biosynthesis